MAEKFTTWEYDRMAVIGGDGEIHYEYMDGFRYASIVGTYWNAVDDYLRNGETDQLEQFEGTYIVTREGNKIYIETDLNAIDELFEKGEIGGEGNDEFFVYEP